MVPTQTLCSPTLWEPHLLVPWVGLPFCLPAPVIRLPQQFALATTFVIQEDPRSSAGITLGRVHLCSEGRAARLMGWAGRYAALGQGRTHSTRLGHLWGDARLTSIVCHTTWLGVYPERVKSPMKEWNKEQGHGQMCTGEDGLYVCVE